MQVVVEVDLFSQVESVEGLISFIMPPSRDSSARPGTPISIDLVANMLLNADAERLRWWNRNDMKSFTECKLLKWTCSRRNQSSTRTSPGISNVWLVLNQYYRVDVERARTGWWLSWLVDPEEGFKAVVKWQTTIKRSRKGWFSSSHWPCYVNGSRIVQNRFGHETTQAFTQVFRRVHRTLINSERVQ